MTFKNGYFYVTILNFEHHILFRNIYMIISVTNHISIYIYLYIEITGFVFVTREIFFTLNANKAFVCEIYPIFLFFCSDFLYRSKSHIFSLIIQQSVFDLIFQKICKIQLILYSISVLSEITI